MMMTDRGGVRELTDALDDLVRLAWLTVVGSELDRIESEPPDVQIVCSSIALSGPGNALVMLFANPVLARLGASVALGVSATAVDEWEIHDVLGEIVNIIGGNLKGFLGEGGDWLLSLPVVSNARQHSPGSRVIADVCFATAGAVLSCQILEHC